MNRLLAASEKEDKTVSSKDMLFATLDTQHRKITMEQGSEFILIDTVGFVSKLPHGLVEAFKSTLEEVKYADLLIHVVDSAYENYDVQMEVTDKVINQLGAGGKERITVYNKTDIAPERPVDATGGDSVYTSALTGENMDLLADMIKEKLFGGRIKAKLLIPYDRGDIVSYLCNNAGISSMSYEAEGTILEGEFSAEDHEKYRKYEII